MCCRPVGSFDIMESKHELGWDVILFSSTWTVSFYYKLNQ